MAVLNELYGKWTVYAGVDMQSSDNRASFYGQLDKAILRIKSVHIQLQKYER
jgi:hypothetical protein